MRKFTTNNLEFNHNWITQSGVTPPDSFTVEYTSDALEVYMEGPPYCESLASLSMPIYTNLPYVGLDLDVYFSETVSKLLQCCGMSTRISVSNQIYDHSAQINYTENGMLQMNDSSHSWTDTGVAIGAPPLINQWLHFSFRYYIDVINLTYSNFSFAWGEYPAIALSSQFANVPTFVGTGADALTVQLQPSLNNVAGAISMRYKNITVSQADQIF